MKIKLKKDVSPSGFTMKKGETQTVILLSSSADGAKFQFRGFIKFLWFDEFEFV